MEEVEVEEVGAEEVGEAVEEGPQLQQQRAPSNQYLGHQVLNLWDLPQMISTEIGRKRKNS